MVKGNFILQIFVILAFALLPLGRANAQVDSLMRVGDSLYRAYRFDDAVDALDQALEMAEDTSSTYDSLLVKSISKRLLFAETNIIKNHNQLCKVKVQSNLLQCS